MKRIKSSSSNATWIKPAVGAVGLALSLAACSANPGEDKDAQASAAHDEAEAEKAISLTPGNTILTAAKTMIGKSVAGEIKEGGTSNFYYFANSGKLRDVVKVRLENTSTTLRPEIKVYNKERSRIASRYDNTRGANIELDVSVDPGDGIYVEVAPFSSAGSYNLSVVAQKAFDEYEANNDQLSAATLQFGRTIEANVMDDADSDWFHVTPATSGKITVSIENLSTTLRPSVKIYNARKSQIASKYDSTKGAGLSFNVDVDQGQDFYIEVDPYRTSGKYRLSARQAVLAGDMASALKSKGLVDLYGVYFDVDKTFVKPESANTLSEVANLLKADPSLRLEVGGHTDDTGTDKHNMNLSQGRAAAVVQVLTGQYGIDPSRLNAKGYGDTKPVAPNDTPSNMAQNRRVELRKL